MPLLRELNVDQIKRGKTDGRGRLYLGAEYKDQELRVAVLESEKGGDV